MNSYLPHQTATSQPLARWNLGVEPRPALNSNPASEPWNSFPKNNPHDLPILRPWKEANQHTKTTMASHLPDGLSVDSIDTLTELTSILIKLRSAQVVADGGSLSSTGMGALGSLGNITGATPSAGGPSGATPAPGAVTGTTPLPSGSAGGANGLSTKELLPATDSLKHKLQRARAAVKTLPDVSRTYSQQRAEIEELEARRLRQLDMLAKIKSAGLQFSLAEQNKGEEGERMVE